MYVGRDFSPSDEGESEIYSLDFVRDCAAGETIASAAWHCTVADDSEVQDEDAASRVSGSSSNSGTVSSQRIAGLVDGVKYVLQAVVVTNQGNTKSLWSHVTCGVPQ
ncbi:hypothetical protein [Bradyrhizobium sp. JYMT SZCCT0428]|uniref:phage fiber-tail adaptor protein n=1 Tax=Bradyrhizobium sp. JYMT SZCCT0428 TaxID=2807673 RepID=UPI001BABEF3A|nr:hypothetical protein [Bradyrhizobium sp. JYMT SZCCT0428]MBR1150083.1 hypothetical protein [Bradyrhizobium sp. JYMT SZCCT0428]